MLSIPARLVFNVVLVLRWLVSWVVGWPFAILRLRQRHFIRIELGGRWTLSQAPSWLARKKSTASYEALDEALTAVEESGAEDNRAVWELPGHDRLEPAPCAAVPVTLPP